MYETKSSKKDADSIASDHPAFVGDSAFWIDLTVDQRNEGKFIGIVDCILTIYHMAKRTVVICRCGELYTCCVAVVEGFADHNAFIRN